MFGKKKENVEPQSTQRTQREIDKNSQIARVCRYAQRDGACLCVVLMVFLGVLRGEMY